MVPHLIHPLLLLALTSHVNFPFKRSLNPKLMQQSNKYNNKCSEKLAMVFDLVEIIKSFEHEIMALI